MVHYITPWSTTHVVHTTFNSFNSFQTSTVRPPYMCVFAYTRARGRLLQRRQLFTSLHLAADFTSSQPERWPPTTQSLLYGNLDAITLPRSETEVDEMLVFFILSHPIVNLRMVKPFFRR